MTPTTAVAISGGIDSLMTAYFLKEQGHHVIGIHFLTGFETAVTDSQPSGADNRGNILDVAEQLDIPLEIVDIHAVFQRKIVDSFTRAYQSGQTPNPCMQCNPTIKFGTILDRAQNLGAQKLATGHYARIQKDANGNYHLFKGHDSLKDQSYFLARLTERQLAKACFPLGEMKKSDVKKKAVRNGLHSVTRAESQDVCFNRYRSYGEFLTSRNGFNSEPGFIEDMNGQIIGEHHGLHLFTIGQRRGINCPAAEPYYVIRLDIERNRLIVGAKKDLLSSECKVVTINWIGEIPATPMEVQTRVRYRSKEVASLVLPQGKHSAIVRFKTPQAAVSPGQGAVFYRGDEILGGGWIN